MTKLAALYLERSAANAQLATGFSSHLGREEPERKKLKRQLPYLGVFAWKGSQENIHCGRMEPAFGGDAFT